jgi:hypothetical protein
LRIFAIAHSGFNFMQIGTQRHCADGPADLKLRML